MEPKPPELEVQPPDDLRDPDIEPILTVLGTFLIPIATSMVQMSASDKRWIEEDRREMLQQSDAIKRILRQARPAFELLDEIILAQNLANREIYPVGSQGVSLSRDSSQAVIEIVKDIVLNLNEIDEACMKLSALPVPDELQEALKKEIIILQEILKKVYASRTYGEKLIWIRRSIRDAGNVLSIIEIGLDEQLRKGRK